MAKRKLTKAERDEWDAQIARMRSNSDWLRRLAERGEARLPPHARRAPGQSNADWLRTLAERAEARLPAESRRDAAL
jgi:hypothetical protein